MLCPISGKFSAQILPRTVFSVAGTQWCSYGGIAAIGSTSSSIGKRNQRASHHCLSHLVSGKDDGFSIKSGVFCRIFSSHHHDHANLISNVHQQRLIQVKWLIEGHVEMCMMLYDVVRLVFMCVRGGGRGWGLREGSCEQGMVYYIAGGIGLHHSSLFYIITDFTLHFVF